jgi:signal transduction histidine kinase/ligand-binding sensor domain-containing protein
MLALLALLALPNAGRAETSGGHFFERVGRVSGPPPEVITAVYQDRTGFIWIGSRDGLILYDGARFVEFEHDIANPRSISDNAIRTIYEDRDGDLWVGTNTGGLNRLDRSSWQFEHFRHDSSDDRSLSHDSVYALTQDRSGDLWVATQRGLNRFDKQARTFERFLADPTDKGALGNDYVTALFEDRDARLWIGTLGGGLYLRDPETGRFFNFRHDPADLRTLSSDEILAISEDVSGRVVLGVMGGVNVMDRNDLSFRRYEQDPRRPTGFTEEPVTALAPGPPGMLWVATYGNGLAELDLETGDIRTWHRQAARRHSLSNDELLGLLVDDVQTLWIATWGGGLNRLTQFSRLMAATPGTMPKPEGSAGGDVTSLMRDTADGTWIGTRAGDLYRKLPGIGAYRRYLDGNEVPRTVLASAEDGSGRIWVGTNGGVVRLEPESGAAREWAHDPEDPESIGPGYVSAILVDRAGRIWIGTGEGGLNVIDENARVLQRFAHDPAEPSSLSDDYVTALLESRDGKLWVGTRSGGLNGLDPESGRAVRYLPDPTSGYAISHHYVTAIVEDRSGTLWVGTGGGGFNRVTGSLKDGDVRFERFTTSDGLIDDDVMAMLEDDDGSLWLSTKRGLSRFDPESGSLANFYVADGLPSAEFEPGAATRSEGRLHFGSVNWVVPVPAGTPFPPPKRSPTVITSIRNVTGEVRGDRPVWELEQVEIPYGDWLSIEFAVLDYNAEHNHGFAYRLGDDREPWVDLGTRRAMTFTNLDPGSYEFAVKGRNCQGVWSQTGSGLTIRVVPPFWMTGWFRGGGVLLVIALAVVGHQIRLSNLESRNRELVALHEQREKAREQLRRAYERLSLLTGRMDIAKEEERKRIARELHDDLGPALTAVIINLQLLPQSADEASMSRRIADTIDIADRLVQRVRDLSLDLRPPLLDELGLIPALKGYLEAQAERTGIEIEVVEETGAEGLLPEVEIAAFRVVQEAVTNVLRHAQAGRVTATIRRRRGRLEISVEDDGVGFDVPATLEAPAGKALGLLGMQERVRMLEGEIEIESSPGRGTRIRVRVPVEETRLGSAPGVSA